MQAPLISEIFIAREWAVRAIENWKSASAFNFPSVFFVCLHVMLCAFNIVKCGGTSRLSAWHSSILNIHKTTRKSKQHGLAWWQNTVDVVVVSIAFEETKLLF